MSEAAPKKPHEDPACSCPACETFKRGLACDATWKHSDRGTCEHGYDWCCPYSFSRGSRRAETQPEEAPDLDKVANYLVGSFLDHHDQPFRVVIWGVGNRNKPVYVCGCGRAFRVGQLQTCPLKPTSGTLAMVGAEP